MNRYRWTNRNHHDVRFEKGLRICYVSPPKLVPLSECFAGNLFFERVDPNDTFAPLRSPPLCFLGGMRRSPRFPIDKSFEGRYTCVHCNERFTSVFAHVPSDAFALYDVKGKKLCCQGCWEKMMMRVSEHLASLSTPKPRRSTSASSASSSATLPEPVDTPPTISRGSGEIAEDVEPDCDGCGKHPSQRTFDAGSHYFTETNTIRRYYMGLPVLPDAVRLCWGCRQDMLTMRWHIGHICKRRTGEDTILTDSVQLPAPCVSQSCSRIVLRETEKSKKRKRETVEVLKEAIRKIKSSSTWQYAALRVGGNRPHLLDQVEAVLPAYEAQDWSFVYKP